MLWLRFPFDPLYSDHVRGRVQLHNQSVSGTTLQQVHLPPNHGRNIKIQVGTHLLKYMTTNSMR